MRTPGAAAVEAEMKGFKVADVASSGNDEFYTPAYAITPLLRHLPPIIKAANNRVVPL